MHHLSRAATGRQPDQFRWFSKAESRASYLCVRNRSSCGVAFTLVKFVLESMEASGFPGLFQSTEKIFNAHGIMWTDATTSYGYCGKGGTYDLVKPSLKT